MLLQLLILIIFLLWPLSSSYAFTLQKAPPLAKPNCQSSCGDVTIPFPFGIGANCYLNDSFAIDCKSNKPFLSNINLEVLNISLENFTIRVQHPVSNSCLSNETKVLQDTPFFYSHRNRFTSIACNNIAYMSPSPGLLLGGCSSICDARGTADVGDCLGIKCCQTTVPSDLQSFNASFQVLNNFEGENKHECKYAFLVDHKWFEMEFTYAEEVQNWIEAPVVLDWCIDNSSLDLSRPEHHSFIDCDETVLPLVCCNCKTGYAGNPYLPGGCHDVDECATNSTACEPHMICKNIDGSFSCHPKTNVYIITLGTGTGLGGLLLLIVGWRLCIILLKRIKRKEEFFK